MAFPLSSPVSPAGALAELWPRLSQQVWLSSPTDDSFELITVGRTYVFARELYRLAAAVIAEEGPFHADLLAQRFPETDVPVVTEFLGVLLEAGVLASQPTSWRVERD